MEKKKRRGSVETVKREGIDCIADFYLQERIAGFPDFFVDATDGGDGLKRCTVFQLFDGLNGLKRRFVIHER